MKDNWIGIIGVVIVLIISVAFVLDNFVNESIAIEEAHKICIERGFDSYLARGVNQIPIDKGFSRIPFTSKPLGVKCKIRYLFSKICCIIEDEEGNILVDSRTEQR